MRHAHLYLLQTSPVLFKGTLDVLSSDSSALARLLRACSDSGNIYLGRNLHHHILHCAHEQSSLLYSHLVHLYVKCTCLDDAESCFLQNDQKHLMAWNCLLGGYADQGKGENAFKLFRQIQQEAFIGDNTTMLNMLCVCTSEADITTGKQIHVQISCSALENDIVVATALVNMYGKIGSMEDAQRTLSNMNMRNVVSWSCMITICTKYGKYKDALQSFDSMLQEGVLPNTFSFVSIISVCACTMLEKFGKHLHARVAGSELEKHPYMGNALMNMYGKCGYLEEAETSFRMTSKESAYSWNMILAAYAHNGKCMDAIKLFNRMLEEKTLPDATTFVYLLSACANQMALSEGMDIHRYITLMGFERELAVSNTLLNLYGKCNCLDVAKSLLKDMPEHDVVSWNTLISGYAHHSLGVEAFHGFQQMIQQGVSPNQVTYTCILDAFISEELLAAGKEIHACVVCHTDVVVTTALVNMYGKCGSLQRALQVFQSRKVQNVLTWNAVFAVCNQHEQGQQALDLFFKMHKEDVRPDNYTLSIVLSSCASQEALMTGKEIHALAVECGFSQDIVVATALINMYGKCGSFADAMGVFETIYNRDVILWTSIIQVSSQHGNGKETIRLLNQMLKAGFVPNHITFLTALSACSHSGLLSEGRQCFTSMQQDYGIVPQGEHYRCMIDLLARSGLLEEAEKLMRGMPFQASYVSWTTLLVACKKENDIECGERVGKHLINIYPEKSFPYVVLSQIYIAAGRDDEAEAVIGQMRVSAAQEEIELEANGEFQLNPSNKQSNFDEENIFVALERVERRQEMTQ